MLSRLDHLQRLGVNVVWLCAGREVAQPFVDAGFDHLVTMNAGPDPDRFMDFFSREQAKPLRALTTSQS